MYLRYAHIENNGPLKFVDLYAPLNSDSTPKPIILVGGNGSGKTNFLSIITDALFEAAANYFINVFPGQTNTIRPWFRVVGASTISVGSNGSATILEFKHGEKSHVFKEKGGLVPSVEFASRIPDSLRPVADWGDQSNNIKRFDISEEQAKSIFESGVYVYFPATRTEYPHWLNRDSMAPSGFDLAPRFSRKTNKPIYVDRSLEQFEQWMLSVILEARLDFAVTAEGIEPVGDVARGLTVQMGALNIVNQLLRIIIDDYTAYFVWTGRSSLRKLGIAKQNTLVPTLEGLSGGQSTLLAIFGTILRYGDSERWKGALPLNEIEGICIIDEIDAHMHVELQNRALPRLIRLFPKMQFIVSSHSPNFVLGMDREFGAEGIQIVEMPNGVAVHAEAYAEFGHALEVLQETKAFGKAVREVAEKPGKILVFLEGETDPKYLETAFELLDRQDLFEKLEIKWIGAKDPNSGQGFHTGKDALTRTLSMLRANPGFAKRPVILLYDNDCNRKSEDYGDIHVRSMPSNSENQRIKAGIENLLPEYLFSDDMFDKSTEIKSNGDEITRRILNKMKLCKYVCEERKRAEDFVNFHDAIKIIDQLLSATVSD